MEYKFVRFLLLLLCFAPPAWAHLPSLIKLTKPAVVTIYVFTDYGEQVNQGSGFFIRPNLLVSSRHIFWKEGLQNASYARAMTNGFDKLEFHIRAVLGDDPENDLIFLLTEPFNNQLTPPYRLNLTMEMEEGEDIFVISSPLGLPGVISTGIISAIHNEQDIQISAAISEGSSGAPILNYQGQVVGVVSGHFSVGQQLNFGVSGFALNNLIHKIQGDASILDPSEIRPILSNPTMQGNKLPTLKDWVRYQRTKEKLKTTTHAGMFSGLFSFISEAWKTTREAILHYKAPQLSPGKETPPTQALPSAPAPILLHPENQNEPENDTNKENSNNYIFSPPANIRTS